MVTALAPGTEWNAANFGFGGICYDCAVMIGWQKFCNSMNGSSRIDFDHLIDLVAEGIDSGVGASG